MADVIDELLTGRTSAPSSKDDLVNELLGAPIRGRLFYQPPEGLVRSREAAASPMTALQAGVPTDPRAAIRVFAYSNNPGGRSYAWWAEVGNHPELFTKEAYQHPKLREFIEYKLDNPTHTSSEFGMTRDALKSLLSKPIEDFGITVNTVASTSTTTGIQLATKFVSETLTKKKATPKLKLG